MPNPTAEKLFWPSDAGCADIGALNRTVKHDLNSLKVRHNFTQGFADDFGTGAAFAFDHTASTVFIAR